MHNVNVIKNNKRTMAILSGRIATLATLVKRRNYTTIPRNTDNSLGNVKVTR